MIIIAKKIKINVTIDTFSYTLQTNLIFNFFGRRLVHILKKYLNNIEKSLDCLQMKMATSRVPANC